MAVIVAQIKRIAEMEVPDDEEGNGINDELKTGPNLGLFPRQISPVPALLPLNHLRSTGEFWWN
ncbi:uncharacterized protein PpBr36_11012 [Pyricularia pennisetigena]|uniref:uncharacterized protein n=1 Tax=Pyricularia pennisetigena TaxID=1578925 RepID=UPI00114F6EA6|nr:uncharacterized protein PpBr36_11012 [Pyricularia pennisetigena]TLS20676.1 hypothetical protein PpBr36_11012 [Pyricularia pennisetigena]